MSDKNRNYWARWADLSGLLAAMSKTPDHSKHLVMTNEELAEASAALEQAATQAIERLDLAELTGGNND